jgi:hypothetical protein
MGAVMMIEGIKTLSIKMPLLYSTSASIPQLRRKIEKSMKDIIFGRNNDD